MLVCCGGFRAEGLGEKVVEYCVGGFLGCCSVVDGLLVGSGLVCCPASVVGDGLGVLGFLEAVELFGVWLYAVEELFGLVGDGCELFVFVVG